MAMKNRFALCGFPVIALVAVLGLVVALGGEKADDVDVGFRSRKMTERKAAYDAAVKRRHALIALAMKLAQEPDDGKTLFGRKECGVRLLGEMRATQAVPILVELIAFRPAAVVNDDSEYSGYPAVEALIGIGHPAAKTIWEKHLASADKKTLPLHLMVLSNVWGDEVCTLLLEARLKAKLPDKAKANLEAALQHFRPDEKKVGKKR
jgi:hypothetical protein